MATFVLVHGAMHGGWCWRDVRHRLAGAGHDVHTPTLSGMGDRRQSLGHQVGVATHVADLTELMWFEDLDDVTLVLHSYAGILAGPVADQAGARVGAIVLLGAFVALPGQSLCDVEPPEVAARYRSAAAAAGDGWLVKADPSFLTQWSVPEGLRAFVGARLTDFPFRCATEPVDYDPGALSRIPCTYVWHTEPPLESLRRSRDVAEQSGWDVREIHSGHDMMLADPDWTSALLEELCAR